VTTTYSHHLLRRRARIKAERLNATAKHNGWTNLHYRVEPAKTGPWRWRVIEVKIGAVSEP
jgi:hypothetical protein